MAVRRNPNRANAAYWTGSVPWISAATLKRTRVYDSDQRITDAAVACWEQNRPTRERHWFLCVAWHCDMKSVRVLQCVLSASIRTSKPSIPRPGLLPEYLTYSIHAQRTRILELVSSAGSGTGVLDTNLLKRLPDMAARREEQQAIIEAMTMQRRQSDSLEKLIVK